LGYAITETETLTFPERPGLEVVVKRATTFADFERIQGIAANGTGQERDKALSDFAELFIESWNLESKGQPLAVSDFGRLPIDLKADILSEWAKGLRGPSAPLGNEPGSSEDSPAPSTSEPENE
jgi:hypothetical protein